MMEIGRVKGHRGTAGEMTVRIHDGDAVDWEAIDRVWLARGDGEPQPYAIASRRAYRDRLVLRLEGVEDGNAAAQWRGARVFVPLEEAPTTDEDVWYHAELEGLTVRLESGATVGTVRAIIPTGATDLLAVTPAASDGAADDDILIPLTRSIVLEVDLDAAAVVVRPPEGLLELNAAPSEDEEGEPS